MNIQELLIQVNDKAKHKGYHKGISECDFLEAITVMQLKDKIKLENGNVGIKGSLEC